MSTSRQPDRLMATSILTTIMAGTMAAAVAHGSEELPSYKVPNLAENGEAYYAPDGVHLIAQVKDPDGQDPGPGKVGGALTYTLRTRRGHPRINAPRPDACSWFYPDGKRLLWTSTRDHLDDMPAGNWSDDADYPQGAELYSSDLDGKNVRRLTNNRWYDAEATVSPDGKWIVFGRQIDGNADLWRMKADGAEQTQLTFTSDWQEGGACFLPDSETVIFRAWKNGEKLRIEAQDRKNGTRTQTPRHLLDEDRRSRPRRAAPHVHQRYELGAIPAPVDATFCWCASWNGATGSCSWRTWPVANRCA
jgi:dipeptidyl aminopeptidase/acylaminoacyl peptidase